MSLQSISKELHEVIIELMNEPLLNDFNLGGGTNLAIKYDHRVSTDIDLFSPGVVGHSKMNEIKALLDEKYAEFDIESTIRNNSAEEENLILINSDIIKNDVSIKIDIIQNLPLNHPVINKDGIRLIHDLDIAPLKLLSAADRGTKKDFYDLYMLAKMYGLSKMHDELMLRHEKFKASEKKYQNIFNVDVFKPKESLQKTITPLGNFNNAGNQRLNNNRVVLTANSPAQIFWPDLKRNWSKMLQELSKEKGLTFKETPKQNRSKGISF